MSIMRSRIVICGVKELSYGEGTLPMASSVFEGRREQVYRERNRSRKCSLIVEVRESCWCWLFGRNRLQM